MIRVLGVWAIYNSSFSFRTGCLIDLAFAFHERRCGNPHPAIGLTVSGSYRWAHRTACIGVVAGAMPPSCHEFFDHALPADGGKAGLGHGSIPGRNLGNRSKRKS